MSIFNGNKNNHLAEAKFEVPIQPLRMKLIHGVEVPDISFKPQPNQDYYYPAPHNTGGYVCDVYYDCRRWHQYRASKGLCYPFTEEGKQAAILHAKAMLGIKE
jgi:hypothetical protein